MITADWKFHKYNKVTGAIIATSFDGLNTLIYFFLELIYVVRCANICLRIPIPLRYSKTL